MYKNSKFSQKNIEFSLYLYSNFSALNLCVTQMIQVLPNCKQYLILNFILKLAQFLWLIPPPTNPLEPPMYVSIRFMFSTDTGVRECLCGVIVTLRPHVGHRPTSHVAYLVRIFLVLIISVN